MRWRAAAAVSAAMAVLLAGCDAGPAMRLVNGLNQPIVLHLGPPGDSRKGIELRPGEARTFDRGETPSGSYAVTVGACVLEFPFPDVSGLNYPWSVPDGKGGSAPDYRYPFPLAQQLQADMRIHLVQAAAGAGRAGPSLGDEGHGFPLSPSRKTCN